MKPRLNQRIDYEYGPTLYRWKIQAHLEGIALFSLWKHHGALQE